jgi:hypothetical protein
MMGVAGGRALIDAVDEMGEIGSTQELLNAKIGRKHTMHSGMNASIGADIARIQMEMDKKARSGRLTRDDKEKVQRLHSMEEEVISLSQLSQQDRTSPSFEQEAADLFMESGEDGNGGVHKALTPVGRKSSMIVTNKYNEPSHKLGGDSNGSVGDMVAKQSSAIKQRSQREKSFKEG